MNIDSVQPDRKYPFLTFVIILGLMRTGAYLLEAFSIMLNKQFMETAYALSGHIESIVFFRSAQQILEIFLTILFVIFAYLIPIRRLFSIVTLFLVIIACLSFGILPFHDFLRADSLAEVAKQTFNQQEGFGLAIPEMVRYWPITIFSLITSVFNASLTALLAWGVFNQITTKSEGFRYYIPIAVLSGFILILHSSFPSFLNVNWIIGLAILYFLISFYLFKRISNRAELNKIEDVKTSKWMGYKGLIFGLGFLASSFYLANMFFNNAVITQLIQLFPNVNEYASAVGNFRSLSALGTIIVSLLCWIIGNHVLNKKGWSSTGLLGTIVTLIVGVIAIGYLSFISPDASSVLKTQYLPLGLASTYQSLLKGLNISLIFPLVQIIYLILPQDIRFKAKLWAEPVIAHLINISGSFINLFIVIMTSSELQPRNSILEVLSIILLLLALLVIIKIGRRKEIHE